MKRLIRKSNTSTEVQIGDTVTLDLDEKFLNKSINDLSRTTERDECVLIDAKENVVRWGLNGETHADLLNQYYHIDMSNNDSNLDIDNYVVLGVYLNNFLGSETIILYNDNVPDVEKIITQENPNIKVYVDTWEDNEIQRIAKRQTI